MLINPDQLPAAAALAAAIPSLRIIIDHCANVRVTGAAPPAAWIEGLRGCAPHRQVFMKVSGLVEGTGQKNGSATGEAAFYRPTLDAVWDSFGEDRVIYGGNWPVSAPFASYPRMHAIVREYVGTKGGAGRLRNISPGTPTRPTKCRAGRGGNRGFVPVRCTQYECLRSSEGVAEVLALLTINMSGRMVMLSINRSPMSDKTDVLRGALDLMVLRALDALGPQHGYGVARRIEQMSESALALNQGTLYPALLRLEQQGWIISKWGVSENNRRARFYSLTARGRRHLHAETARWSRIASVLSRFLAPTEDLT